jgi:flagellar hook assembly protein FlgD
MVTGILDETANSMTIAGQASVARLTLRAGYVSGVGGDVIAARTGFVSLFPNPFNPTTHVTFDLAKAGPVDVAIYDVRGQLVRTLATGTMNSGRHDLVWQGRDDAGRSVASGVYFCRLSADGGTQSRKMILAR